MSIASCRQKTVNVDLPAPTYGDMEDSPSHAPTPRGGIPTRQYCYGLQDLEGEILALVGVAAGLKTSLRLSVCCVSLRDALTCPLLDQQLYGTLYAAFAGVEKPSYALPQPSLRPEALQAHGRSVHVRAPPSNVQAQNYTSDDRDRHGVGPAVCAPNSRPQTKVGSMPGLKRSRSPCSASRLVDASGRTAPVGPSASNDEVGSQLRSGGGRASALAVARQGEEIRYLERTDLPRWRTRLKRDLVTKREPSEASAFPANGRGRQDVLMVVVPSNPPIIATTCTTELSLFDLDGDRLPIVAITPQRKGQRNPAEHAPQGRKGVLAAAAAAAATEATDAPAGGERRCSGDGGKTFLSQRMTCSASRRPRCSGHDGLCADGQGGDDDDSGGSGGGEDSDCKGDGSEYEGDEGSSKVTDLPAEGHQRDIRCLAASPAGDMVATGSLDCTIRVRPVPGRGWVRRLRGHKAGVRCLLFHLHKGSSILVSADSQGMMATWEVFPVSRRLQMVRGHTDSVQVLTWAGGGKRLASGALDGSVVVWSLSPEEGTLVPLVTHGDFCHPYRIVAVGRCLAFTSSAHPSALTGPSSPRSSSSRGAVGANGDNNGEGGVVGSRRSPQSKGAHVSVVDIDFDSPSSAARYARPRRLSTGLARLQHLVAGACLGTVMMSQAESWAEESDGSSDADDWLGDSFLGGGRVTYRPPRLCRIGSSANVTSYEVSHAPQSKSYSAHDSDDDVGAPGGRWLNLSRCQGKAVVAGARWCSGMNRRGLDGKDTRSDVGGSSSISGNNGSYVTAVTVTQNDGETPGSDAFGGSAVGEREDGPDDYDDERGHCTCAVFVGRTVFLGYDTGLIHAHHAGNGRRLYRLKTPGALVHLVEAGGSLFAYSYSGVVSRWSWERPMGGDASTATVPADPHAAQ